MSFNWNALCKYSYSFGIELEFSTNKVLASVIRNKVRGAQVRIDPALT